MKSQDVPAMQDALKNMAFPVVLVIENPDGTKVDAVIKGLSKVQYMATIILSGGYSVDRSIELAKEILSKTS